MLLHLAALAFWFGAIVFFLIVLGPATRDVEPRVALAVLDRGRSALERSSWLGISLLFLTGIINLVWRVEAAGGQLAGIYLILLSAKLLVFGAMLVHHCVQVFKYAPRISRAMAGLPTNISAWPESLLADWRRWFLLLKINAALGPFAVVLGLALFEH